MDLKICTLLIKIRQYKVHIKCYIIYACKRVHEVKLWVVIHMKK